MDAYFRGGHFALLKSKIRHFLGRFGRGGQKRGLFLVFFILPLESPCFRDLHALKETRNRAVEGLENRGSRGTF